MNIKISPPNSLIVLLCMVGFLVLTNIAGIVAKFAFGQESLFGLIGLFDLHSERNIPTLFSSLQLILAGLLLLLIGSKHQSNGEKYIAWIVLAAIFLFLAIDETAVIHERLGDPMRTVLNPGGLFYFPWVIPYGIALFIYALLKYACLTFQNIKISVQE